MARVFDIEGKEHVFESESDEVQCSCAGVKCPMCNSYVHVQFCEDKTTTITVCETCQFESCIKPTLSDR